MSQVTNQYLAALLCSACFTAFAQESKVGDITITQPWARPTVAGQQGGGGFVRLSNVGKAGDKLVSASSPAAQRMELHTMKMEGDVMRMRQVPSIDLNAGESVDLKPGGMHVMFMGLKEPLVNGSKIPVTFVFEKAGKVTVDFTVQPRPAHMTSERTTGHDMGEHKH